MEGYKLDTANVENFLKAVLLWRLSEEIGGQQLKEK